MFFSFNKRNFKPDEIVYVLDYWASTLGVQASEAEAKILKVDCKTGTFTAVLYGDTYNTYSFKDYGRLIFDNLNEAIEAAKKVPKPQTIIYQKNRDKIYKKIVRGVDGRQNEGCFDLILHLSRGKPVSTKELGHSLFLSESEARESENK